MNKSLITNITALSVTVFGSISPVYSTEIFTAGLFAISGAITNWFAIHMLFEKVPFLYGSGIIVSRFEDFKIGIKNLIIKEFFNKESVKEIFDSGSFDKITFLEKLDYDNIYNKFVESIEESSLGSMLKMVGGKKALEPLRDPLKSKVKEIFEDLLENNINKKGDLEENIHTLIDQRLNQLSPEDVKSIIKNIMHQHLGWLVVWGGIFGFILGLSISFLGGLN